MFSLFTSSLFSSLFISGLRNGLDQAPTLKCSMRSYQGWLAKVKMHKDPIGHSSGTSITKHPDLPHTHLSPCRHYGNRSCTGCCKCWWRRRWSSCCYCSRWKEGVALTLRLHSPHLPCDFSWEKRSLPQLQVLICFIESDAKDKLLYRSLSNFIQKHVF